MTSPILLGGTQVSERALAHATYSSGGSEWVASGVTGRVGLIGHTITVQNPNGAVIHGVFEGSCWTSVGGLIQGSTVLDANPQAIWGLFCWGLTGDHTQFRFAWSYNVGPGAHSIGVGLWVASGSINFDGQDGGTSSCWERV